MKYFEFDFSTILGCGVGIEWAPKGTIEDDFGHIIIDILIFRVLLTYN